MTSGRDLSTDIDAAVADVYDVLQRVRREDLAAGAIKQHTVHTVDDNDGLFSLSSHQAPDTLPWAQKLDRTDGRMASLQGPASFFAKLANVAPYDGRPIDGWEVIVGIAIAMQAYDFVTGADFALDAIQLRVREALMRDSMIERTILGIFGVRTNEQLTLGDRSWLIPGTLGRRAHLAERDELTYPLVHSHLYILSDRIVPSSELRSGKRDALPWELLGTLRSVARADMLVFGPWFETSVMLPSRFAGFTTFQRAPELPLSYSYPADDVVVTGALADEAVKMHALINGKPTKELKPYVRSLQLAVERLTMAASRNSLPDALLDLMIALEALLSKQGEKTEITYRIALRGAHASTATNAAERVSVRKMLGETYHLRSEVVHGATGGSDLNASQVAELRAFVARAIRLSAVALEGGVSLVEQIEQALLGDSEAIRRTVSTLS